MRLTLRAKYSLIILLAILSVVVLLTGAFLLQSKSVIQKVTTTSSRVMEEDLLDQLEYRAESLIRPLSGDLAGPLYRRDTEKIYEIAEKVKKHRDVSYIYVYDRTGRLVCDGTEQRSFLNRILDDPISKNAVASQRPLFQFSKDSLDAAMPIKHKDELLGGVRVGFFLKPIMVDIAKMKGYLGDIGRKGIRQNIIVTAVIAAILSILGIMVASYVAKNLSRPISLISSLTRRIGRGEYDINIPIRRSDEIGQLTDAFNKMTKDLRETTFSRNFLHNILKSMVDPLIVSDSEKKIHMINRATCYLLAYRNEDELIGRPLDIIFSEIVKKSLEAERLIKLINQGIMYYETSFQTKHGKEIPVLVSGSSIRDRDNNVMWTICTAADITERKLAEKKLKTAYMRLKETQSQLIQAEKLEAIGRMASGVAHEVKNPLSVVLQGVNCLEMSIAPEQRETFEILQKIKNNIERADNIIRGLVDFSRLTELQIGPEDINFILENSIGLVHHKMKLEKITISRELENDLPNVSADKRKLEQVFINIFLNAIQAMPEGGRLFIRSYLAVLETQRSRISKNIEGYFKEDEKAVIVEIEDTGVGIADKDLRKVFDPFFTTKETGEGSGLGLSVTRNIVDLHKGYIEIDSRVNKGTKVTIALKIFTGRG